MLAQSSTQVMTRDALTAVGGDPNDLGSTSNPTGFTPPTFNINCTQKPGSGWSAQLQILQMSREGTNTAYHLGPGTYSTDLMFSGGALANFTPGANSRRVYIEVSQALANDSRDAEQEHCRDIRRAYDLTFGTVQTALNRVRNTNPHQWYDKRDKAIRAVKAEIVNGMHERLAAIVRGAIGEVGSVNIHQFATQLSELYLALVARTQDRDAQGWHTLTPDRNSESYSAQSWVAYAGSSVLPSKAHSALLGEVKDIRKLVRGPAFQVNVTPSTTVINL